MTPAAVTPAARRSTRRRGSDPSAPGAGARGDRPPRSPRPPGPGTIPRRVSGPAGGRAAAARGRAGAATRAAAARGRAGAATQAAAPRGRAAATQAAAAAPALPRPVRAPRPRAVPAPEPAQPRREVPRPGRAATTVRSRPRPVVAPPLPRRALAAVRRAPDHALLDRIVRGRAWIPLLGVMLVGIVAMQVEVLKYGASIGRALENTSVLQSRNELLRASVSALSSDQRIEREAARMGMAMPGPGAYTFLDARGDSIGRALRAITPPSASFQPAAAAPAPGG
jgi:hypothetical protein